MDILIVRYLSTQANNLLSVPIQKEYLDSFSGGNVTCESAADIELVIYIAPGIAQVTVYGVPHTNPVVVEMFHEMANLTQPDPR